MFGLEHPLHAKYHGVSQIIGNAFMFSKWRKHPFIKTVIDNLSFHARQYNHDKNSMILNSTGPLMITEIYNQYSKKYQIKLLAHRFLYPLQYADADQVLSVAEKPDNGDRLTEAFAVHYHIGSWWK